MADLPLDVAPLDGDGGGVLVDHVDASPEAVFFGRVGPALRPGHGEGEQKTEEERHAHETLRFMCPNRV